MSKMITSSSGGDYSTIHPQIMYSDVEMKIMEEETAPTVDSSTLAHHHLPSPANYVNSPLINHNSAVRVPSKGKGGKKVRTDDDDEEIDLDKCIAEDHNRISVKILRKVIPKLRIACYYSDEQVSGKKKLKHLWDEKPADWPENVPFKDPNNAIKDAKKPGKDELAPMYDYLRERYLEKKSNGEIPSSFPSVQPVQDIASVGGSGNFQEGMYVTMVPNLGQMSQSEDDGHSVGYHTNAPASEDNKYWNSQLTWGTVQPTIHEQSRSSMLFSMDENRSAAVLAPTAPTRAEHQSLVMNRQLLQNLTAIPEQVTTNWHGQVGSEPVTRSSRVPPAPVHDLYVRLKEKQNQVEAISGHNRGVQILLSAVQKEVIDCLYDKLLPDDTRLCLMFLDMGHQYEALLDVMLVLDKMEEGEQKLLHSGCQEIIQKFNKECSTLMALFGITQLRDPDTGMINSTVKSAVYGLPETFLQGLVNGDKRDKLSSVCLPDDDKKDVEFVPTDASTLGIRQRELPSDQGLTIQLDLTPYLMRDIVCNPDPIGVDDIDDKKEYSDLDEFLRVNFSEEQQQLTLALPNLHLVETDQTTTQPAFDCSTPQSAAASLFGGHQSGLTSGHDWSASAASVFGGQQSGFMSRHDSGTSFVAGGALVGADVSLVSSGNGINDCEAMDLDGALLDDIDDVISNQTTTSDLLLCSGGAVNQWANSSLPYGATSNHVDYCSLPTSWPNSTESGFRFVPDLRGQQPTSGLGQTGLRSMAGAGMPIPRQNSIAIPLSVANASVDDMDDEDRRSQSRKRQSRGSVHSRNGRQHNGRT